MVLPKVYENCYVKVRAGKFSFWYDEWIQLGPLVERTHLSQNPRIKIRDCWNTNIWNVELLNCLVGEEITEEILMSNIKRGEGEDFIIWKLNTKGRFRTSSTWEVIRWKGEAN